MTFLPVRVLLRCAGPPVPPHAPQGGRVAGRRDARHAAQHTAQREGGERGVSCPRVYKTGYDGNQVAWMRCTPTSGFSSALMQGDQALFAVCSPFDSPGLPA